MDVMALVGPSGTGKSHRALIVAHEYNADAIIDDGLFIMDNKIVAGYSAKKEPSKVKAVKRAIFMDEEHSSWVRDTIKVVQPQRILILGTSVNMINKIIAVLELPLLSMVVRIEQIASVNEINRAREIRLKEGKHIIPVPTIELQPHFSDYLIDPLQIFFKKPQTKYRKVGEKSIVRPRFSYYGKLVIANSATAAIVDYIATTDMSITRTGQISIRNYKDKEKGILISLDVTIKYGSVIRDVVLQAQQRIKTMVEYMTGMTVQRVNIDVKRISLD